MRLPVQNYLKRKGNRKCIEKIEIGGSTEALVRCTK